MIEIIYGIIITISFLRAGVEAICLITGETRVQVSIVMIDLRLILPIQIITIIILLI